MTRINCVPVATLTRAHLVAEYRELPRARHAWPRRTAPQIPATYRMGKGHVTFFYDKGLWLERRHRALVAEMQARGYVVNLPPLDLAHWPEHAMNDWQPTAAAVAISEARIQERLAEAKE